MAAAPQTEAFGRDSLIVNQQEKKKKIVVILWRYFFFLRLLRKVRKTRNMTPCGGKITGNLSLKK